MSHQRIMEELNTKSLDKKLMAYAVAAGAVLSGASPADAAIVNTDTSLTLNSSSLYNIEFNGALKFTIFFSKSSTGSFASNMAFVTPFSTDAYFLGTSIGIYAKGLATNYVISGGKSYWTNTTAAGTMAGHYRFGTISSNAGQFRNKTAFLGLKFRLSGNTHYGWCKVTIPADVSSLTVSGQAYEDDHLIGGIRAGETDVSLAVTLNNFVAEALSDGIQLEWYTESEVDNLGFILERRMIGDTPSAWQTIASYESQDALKGAGNSTSRTEYMFTDSHIESNTTYEYRLISVSTSGEKEISQAITVINDVIVPESLVLHQNFPNPFNSKTAIQFALPEDQKVTLKIFSIDGKLVDTLINEKMSKGPHEVMWDAKDMVSGNYIYELKSGSQRIVKKLNYLK